MITKITPLLLIVVVFPLFISPVGISLLPNTRWNKKENYHMAALILARGGSKGIINKNLAIIQNKTLIGRTLSVLIKFGKFDSIWVSTDNIVIAEEASNYGASVYLRVKEFATDEATSVEAVKEFTHFHSEIDVIALVQCTSPLLFEQALDSAVEMIKKHNFDSVFAVTVSHKLRWVMKTNGTVYPVNFNPLKRPRRQLWSGEFVETGMFYFTKIFNIDRGTLQGGVIGVVQVPQNTSLEIDTQMDLQVARILAPLFNNA